MGFFNSLGHTFSKGFNNVEHIASKGIKGAGHLVTKASKKGGVLDQIFQTGKSLITAPTKLFGKGLDILSNPIIIIAIVVGAVFIVPKLIK